MIVIADAGPLIALAKVDALPILFDLYPHVLITPAVYDETITRGLALGADDAGKLEAAFQAGRIEVHAVASDELPVGALLGAGEIQSILLAVQLRADRLLIDDQVARRAAEQNFAAVGIGTQAQGTLGVIVSAVGAEHISRLYAVEFIQALKSRPDVWLSAELCDRLIQSLQQVA